MKVRNTVKYSLLAGLIILTSSTAGGAKLLGGGPKKAPSPAASEPVGPELAAADQKVAKAKEQWDTAKKQLEAAKALLRAAEADYKAAIAAREALSLQLKADGLAGASGLKQLAEKPAVPAAETNQPTRLTTAPAPTTEAAQAQPQQQGEFNVESAQQPTPDAPQLR